MKAAGGLRKPDGAFAVLCSDGFQGVQPAIGRQTQAGKVRTCPEMADDGPPRVLILGWRPDPAVIAVGDQIRILFIHQNGLGGRPGKKAFVVILVGTKMPELNRPICDRILRDERGRFRSGELQRFTLRPTGRRRSCAPSWRNKNQGDISATAWRERDGGRKECRARPTKDGFALPEEQPARPASSAQSA